MQTKIKVWSLDYFEEYTCAIGHGLHKICHLISDLLKPMSFENVNKVIKGERCQKSKTQTLPEIWNANNALDLQIYFRTLI